MKIKKNQMGWFLGALLTLFLGVQPAQATYDYRYDSKDDLHMQYESSSGEKLTRGMTNVLFGWTEIGRTPTQMAAGIERGKVGAFLLGVPYGAVRAVGRTLVGAYEIATCFAPQSPIMPNIQGDVV